MAVCLIMSAYFSATETAFLSINKTKLKTMVENGNKRAALVLKLEEKYDRLISTILIGNNIVNILLSSIATLFFISIMMGDQNTGSILSTVVCTVVVLIFGEVTPKNLAKQFPDAFAMFSAPIIRFIGWILMSINDIFIGWKKLVSLIIRPKEEEKMSQEELLMFVEEVQ
jgi:Mg2+/Co2+ transporter CorB